MASVLLGSRESDVAVGPFVDGSSVHGGPRVASVNSRVELGGPRVASAFSRAGVGGSCGGTFRGLAFTVSWGGCAAVGQVHGDGRGGEAATPHQLPTQIADAAQAVMAQAEQADRGSADGPHSGLQARRGPT